MDEHQHRQPGARIVRQARCEHVQTQAILTAHYLIRRPAILGGGLRTRRPERRRIDVAAQMPKARPHESVRPERRLGEAQPEKRVHAVGGIATTLDARVATVEAHEDDRIVGRREGRLDAAYDAFDATCSSAAAGEDG